MISTLVAAATLTALTPTPDRAVSSARPGDVLCQFSNTASGGTLALVDNAGGRVALRGEALVATRKPLRAGPLNFAVREAAGSRTRVSRMTLQIAPPPTGVVPLGPLPTRAGFADEFDQPPRLVTSALPGGRWKTQFWFGDQAGDTSRTLGPINHSSNNEAEIYVDPGYKGLDLQPFSVHDGILSIKADHTPAAIRNRLSNLPYTSGLLTTETSFAFTVGYVEVRALMPRGRGLWPAPLWLLPVPTRDAKGERHVNGEQEIDAVEVLMQEPAKAYLTLHDPKGGQSVQVLSPDAASAWHTYGILKTDKVVVWTIDGSAVYSLPTPGGLKGQPVYILLDLAVGGDKSWPGPPDASTPFPAELKVDYVRAFTFQ